ncbi:hypothetical protein DACRYDRAFT_90868 [Dacryopinax primogenitus]|uniref:Uncharacterized protein n=1 Tax=Dacryopinax primogenitus (strain DJM 731) TaxID=1858805 RepID=M5FTR8_DACPD|nr:uncharacterized protein DACRYDRAFT_90868 [Dacryopinax primogenitus]EJT98834.1 hypothetical protein DACRYDRAFT_90868 [Dacryopinax primogenitus]
MLIVLEHPVEAFDPPGPVDEEATTQAEANKAFEYVRKIVRAKDHPKEFSTVQMTEQQYQSAQRYYVRVKEARTVQSSAHSVPFHSTSAVKLTLRTTDKKLKEGLKELKKELEEFEETMVQYCDRLDEVVKQHRQGYQEMTNDLVKLCEFINNNAVFKRPSQRSD